MGGRSYSSLDQNIVQKLSKYVYFDKTFQFGQCFDNILVRWTDFCFDMLLLIYKGLNRVVSPIKALLSISGIYNFVIELKM